MRPFYQYPYNHHVWDVDPRAFDSLRSQEEYFAHRPPPPAEDDGGLLDMKRRAQVCKRCHGKGLVGGMHGGLTACNACGGSGHVSIKAPRDLKNASADGVVRVEDAVSSDLNYYDVAVGPTAVGCYTDMDPSDSGHGYLPNDTANAFVMNQVPQGVGWGKRTGQGITMQAIRVMGMLSAFEGVIAPPSEDEVAVAAIVKLYVIYEISPSSPSNMPAWTTLFQTYSNMAMQSFDALDLYQILFTHVMKTAGAQFQAGTITIVGDTADGGGTLYSMELSGAQVPFDFTVPLNDLPTAWTSEDTTGTYSNMVTGGLHLYALCDPNVNQSPILRLSTRLTFTSP